MLVPIEEKELAGIINGESISIDGFPFEDGALSRELRESAPLIYNELVHGEQKGPVGAWAVLERSTGTVIGDVGFVPSANEENTLKLGYSIVPSMRNRGYGTLAVGSLLEEVKGKWNIIAEVNTSNTASKKILAANGFFHVSSEHDMEIWQYGVIP
ncbi:MAG: GNAT family N-acetyltransferase [Candidatus Thermoplasmatota archaeon]|nr:GNAT family N-acetyltransferase [Candidatus Thermoplasmatota archaeon]